MRRVLHGLLLVGLLLCSAAPAGALRATPHLDVLEELLEIRLASLSAPADRSEKRQAKLAARALARLGAETATASADLRVLKKLARPLLRSFPGDAELEDVLGTAEDAFEADTDDAARRLGDAHGRLPEVKLTRKAGRLLGKAEGLLEAVRAQASAEKRIALLWKALRTVEKAETLLARALGAPEPTRLVLTPPSALLAEDGATVQLHAAVLDQLGRPMAAPVAWRSSAPLAAEVDAAGLVTAGAVGSARVIAEVAGLSAAAVIVSARPAPGALLVGDAQVASLPEPVDPGASYGLGFAYTVLLEGVAPQLGDLLVGTGSIPLGGRVVGVAGGDPALVTLEIVGLETLFSELSVAESFDPGPEDFEVPDEVAEAYEVEPGEDGSWQFLPREDAPSAARSAARGAQGTVAQSVGPFSCESGVSFPLGLNSPPSFSLQPQLSVDFAYNTSEGLRRLVARGQLTAQAAYKPRIQAAVSGKVTCKAFLLGIRIPVPGPLAFVIGGYVPVGVGFEADGTVNVAQVGFDATAQTIFSAEVGVDCAGGSCEAVQQADSQNTSSFAWVLPNVLQQFSVELAVRGFGYFELRIGNPLWQALQLSMAEGRAGAQQTASLAPLLTQVENTGYASDYKLTLFAQVGSGVSLRDVLDAFSLNLAAFELKTEIEVARSPQGSLAFAGPAGAGDTAEATVTLSDVAYFGVPNVARVRVYRHDGPLLVERASVVPASPGQTEFRAEWEVTPQDVGASFVAAVTTQLLAGLELEPGPDTHRSLEAGASGRVALTGRRERAGVEAFADPGESGQSDSDFQEQDGPSGGPRELSVQAAFGGGAAEARITTDVVLDEEDGLVSVTASGRYEGSVSPGFRAEGNSRLYLDFEVLETADYSISGQVNASGGASAGLQLVSAFDTLRCLGQGCTVPGPFTGTGTLEPGVYSLRVSGGGADVDSLATYSVELRFEP